MKCYGFAQTNRFIALVLTVAAVTSAHAFTWQDLWSRRDEQGQYFLNHAKPKKAAALFTDPMWRAVAYYRSGNYEKAADEFSRFDIPLANYNRANALAHQGQFEEAIDVYDRVLKQQPDNKDASYNRDLLKQLLKRKSQGDVKHTEESDQDKKDDVAANQTQGDPGKEKSSQKKSREKKSQQSSSGHKQKTPGQHDAGNQKPANNPAAQNGVHSRQDVEREQASKQWLSRIPDDPGGLLKEKFMRDHLRRKQQSQS